MPKPHHATSPPSAYSKSHVRPSSLISLPKKRNLSFSEDILPDIPPSKSHCIENLCCQNSKPKPSHNVSGNSWVYQKALRQKVATDAANFTPNKCQLRRFQEKICADDPHAEFDPDNLLRVRCSTCAEWIQMRVPYDCKHWKQHRITKKCQRQQSSKLVTKSLRTFFMPLTSPESAGTALCHVEQQSSRNLPCPGLQASTNEAIRHYLQHSSMLGGGAPSRVGIAQKLFPDLSDHSWGALDNAQQDMVLNHEQASFRWLNQHGLGAVFSAGCKNMSPASNAGVPAPCTSCIELRKLHIFQNILNRKIPDEKNMKYVPKSYRCQKLGSIYLKYHGVHQLIKEVCSAHFPCKKLTYHAFTRIPVVSHLGYALLKG